ncbi:MAG: hypothetical protein N2512_13105 [Armatimonadetes bacterium]|nr:hypothetical protein [Armatimonadota bacterium]
MRYYRQARMIAVVAFLGVLAAAVLAGDPPAGQAQGGPRMGPGPHGRGQGASAGKGDGERFGGRGRQGIGPGRGYIEPTAETKALWDKLGRIQADLHAAQWDLFVLMAQKPRNQQKINAQQQKIKKLRDEMRSVWEKLRPHWHPLDSQAGGKPSRRGGRAGQQGSADKGAR